VLGSGCAAGDGLKFSALLQSHPETENVKLLGTSATAADPGEAPADGTQVACVDGEECPQVVCVEGKPCFKDLTLGGPIQQHINSDLKTK
jgi:hypothetical protein